jgi:hypothetical protein
MKNIPLIACDSDPLSDMEIRKLELVTGDLPEDYRSFLRVSNGGRPAGVDIRFPSPVANGEYRFVSSFTIQSPTDHPETVHAWISNRSMKLLVVADCNNSPVLLSLDKERFGEIYIWHYDLARMEKTRHLSEIVLDKEAVVFWIAPSFSDFLELLEIVERPKVRQELDFQPSVENFAKHGDSCFDTAKQFFDNFTTQELNQSWPLDGKPAFPPIYRAANWSQFKTVNYLISRGVDTRFALINCLNSLEITEMLIANGATASDLQALLKSAAAKLACTNRPEEVQKIIRHVVGLGIKPDFENASVVEEWKELLGSIYNKKILHILKTEMGIPFDVPTGRH